jgi:type IX secretion system PorP/SprF family membrane protein|tara:strand:- start:503 stop:1423 length:921 start_codon:yes stop_codon:yes gene_type:complete
MKKITPIFIGFILLFSLMTQAQQTPHYTQYMYNMQTINPGYVGARADLSISLLNRSQWVGVEGAPKTTTFSLNGRAFDGVGFGVTVINDKLGLAESTNVNLDASYTIVTSQYGRLSLGLKGGVTTFNNNLSEGITPDNDLYGSTNGSYPNIGVGAFYYNERFYAGLSMPYLLKTPQFRIDDTNTTSGLSENINYFVTAGMRFELTNDIMFKPSTMIKYTSNLPISIDLNSNFLYKDQIEFGVSYRYNDSASAMFAVILNEKFRIGYTYDHTLTSLGNSLGSHEIMLHLDLDFKKKGRWLHNTKCYF